MNLLKIRKLKEYQPVSFNEKVIILFKIFIANDWVNCNLNQVLYEPMIVQISFSKDIEDHDLNTNSLKLYSFINHNKVNAILGLKYIRSIEIESDKIYLFEVINAKLHLNLIKRIYLKRIYNLSQRKKSNFFNEFNFDIYKKLVALFSIPKQVWLVSIFNQKENHFPIDLCAIKKNHITIGVRNTNQSINELKIGNTFFLSQPAAEDYKQVYSLGKFICKKEKINTLKINDIILPNIILKYFELSLVSKIEFENQSIYISKIINEKKINQLKKPLYHLHKIWLLNNSKYKII
ncbi:hypothetical protein [Flavobacterium sp. J27]|uniref:hypothetical protein n=1 Tax=Flavobacterium sp. J27 TaxID=2060419 RepID=UPI00102FF255|nr:hypothetical protein [Flavobacterium sp. J27]